QSAHRTPRGESFPEQRQNDHRQIGRGGNGKSQRHQKRYIRIRAEQNSDGHRDRADDKRGDPGDAYFFSGPALSPAMYDVRVKVVRERSRSTDCQTGNDRENGGEGNGRDERKEEIAAERLCQQRSAHIRAAAGRNFVTSDDRRRAKTQKSRQDVER